MSGAVAVEGGWGNHSVFKQRYLCTVEIHRRFNGGFQNSVPHCLSEHRLSIIAKVVASHLDWRGIRGIFNIRNRQQRKVSACEVIHQGINSSILTRQATMELACFFILHLYLPVLYLLLADIITTQQLFCSVFQKLS